MQTFVPYEDHARTARALDRLRLGKQRVECKQILRALAGDTTGWVNHPATRMWRGHERALCDYAAVICVEWLSRGYRDSLLPWFTEMRERLPEASAQPPTWWGRAEVHASHQARLLAKHETHYRAAFNLGDDEVSHLLTSHPAYVWPA